MGTVVERCRARAVPAWQASEDFVWSCGAFRINPLQRPVPGMVSAVADTEKLSRASLPTADDRPHQGRGEHALHDGDGLRRGEVLLPFGWGMLYVDTRRSGLAPNLAWHVCTALGEVGDDDDRSMALGRPCWLELVAAPMELGVRSIAAGEELVVDRGGLRVAEGAGELDIASFALGLTNPMDLRRAASSSSFPDCGVCTATTSCSREGCAVAKEENLSGGIVLSPPLPLVSDRPLALSRASASISHPAGGGVLRLAASGRHGVGVFAARGLKRGEVLEVAPVVTVADNEIPTYGGTFSEFCHVFSDYCFDGRVHGGNLSCLPLGFGGLYNHSSCPNVEQRWAYAEECPLRVDSGGAPPPALDFCYAFVAMCDVAEGEELLQDYGEGYWQARGEPPR